jgi:DNA repair protein NreA
MSFCKFCGAWSCKKHTLLLGKTVKISEFSGSSPPEIFVGKWNYPNVYTGILSPEKHGNTESLSNHEIWHKQNFQIPQILSLRNQLIYGRKQTNIKDMRTRFISILKEVALTHKSIDAEFKLHKPITKNPEKESKAPLINNSAQLSSVKLTSNPKVKKKVDYLTSDMDLKSVPGIIELHKGNISNTLIIKLLSAGLLGLKKNRRLVPTRWSITAVDDTISKNLLLKIKQFPQISNYQSFNSEYLGNHYEFLLIPDSFAFEVIEISLKNFQLWQDHEGIFPRKTYADKVTGAYYANHLALTEHLTKIKRQASCLVFREIRPEYYAPLGVGILRETSRKAFSKNSNKFNTLREALQDIQTRLRLPIEHFIKKSQLLNNLKAQTKIFQFTK